MPGGDRRGPEGRGPLTGRGLGYCAGFDRPGYTADALPYGRGNGWGGGRGFGRGRGFGHGYRGGYEAVPRNVDVDVEQGATRSLIDEVSRLREQLQALERRLAAADDAD